MYCSPVSAVAASRVGHHPGLHDLGTCWRWRPRDLFIRRTRSAASTLDWSRPAPDSRLLTGTPFSEALRKQATSFGGGRFSGIGWLLRRPCQLFVVRSPRGLRRRSLAFPGRFWKPSCHFTHRRPHFQRCAACLTATYFIAAGGQHRGWLSVVRFDICAAHCARFWWWSLKVTDGEDGYSTRGW